MAGKQIKVILIETFKGERYLLRLDKDYEQALLNLFKNLFKRASLGSIAHISIRLINEEEYNKVNPSPDFMKQKGVKDGKEEKVSEKP